jgi:hypothetical protein
MAIDSVALFNALTSLAASSGQFDVVTGHEPKGAPTLTGVSCAVWVSDLRTIQSSGLASVSMRIEFTMRVYTNMLQEPQDSIDPRILGATDAIFSALAGNFDIDVNGVRYIDVLGSDGEALRATAGFADQDGKKFRVMEIFVPVILNDVYAEVI